MLRFNQLLAEVGIDPAQLRLLRHQPTLPSGKHLLDLWRADRHAFDAYQSLQDKAKRAHFAHPYWASFIGTWDGRTVFAGLYEVSGPMVPPEGMREPFIDAPVDPETTDHYGLTPIDSFAAYAGRLIIEWGGGSSGKRAWVQRADRQNKPIIAILERSVERPFPGYIAFRERLADLATLPTHWQERLVQVGGVYVLSCPDAGWLYVGSATGREGFLNRWQSYVANGHGGNIGLRDIDMANAQVSILELAGSAASRDDIIGMEETWKVKLQSRKFGRNRG